MQSFRGSGNFRSEAARIHVPKRRIPVYKNVQNILDNSKTQCDASYICKHNLPCSFGMPDMLNAILKFAVTCKCKGPYHTGPKCSRKAILPKVPQCCHGISATSRVIGCAPARGRGLSVEPAPVFIDIELPARHTRPAGSHGTTTVDYLRRHIELVVWGLLGLFNRAAFDTFIRADNRKSLKTGKIVVTAVAYRYRYLLFKYRYPVPGHAGSSTESLQLGNKIAARPRLRILLWRLSSR